MARREYSNRKKAVNVFWCLSMMGDEMKQIIKPSSDSGVFFKEINSINEKLYFDGTHPHYQLIFSIT